MSLFFQGGNPEHNFEKCVFEFLSREVRVKKPIQDTLNVVAALLISEHDDSHARWANMSCKIFYLQ